MTAPAALKAPRHALVLCASYDQPPSRCAGLYLLPEASEVRLSRHPAGEDGKTAWQRHGAGPVLAVPDVFMSQPHAVLRLDQERQLRAEDLGSKNGTRLCGLPLRHTSRPLRHGDQIETGHTLWRLLLLSGDEGEQLLCPAPQRLVPGWPGTLSPLLRRVLAAVNALGPTPLPVLLQGEPGTGKRALGQFIHDLGDLGRARGPLIHVPPGGHVPALREGPMTLLLEEVGRLPLIEQQDLLRLVRGDGRREPPLVICTTDVDLHVLARGGAFRADLLQHLSAVVLALPPLRERLEDLGLLCEYHLDQNDGASATQLTPDVWRHLFAHDWPGNQRELSAVLKRAANRRRERGRRLIDVDDLPEAIQRGWHDPVLPGVGPPVAWVPAWTPAASGADGADPGAPLPPPPDKEARREALVQALSAEGGKVARAARRLGLSRVHLHRLARQLGVNVEEFRKLKG